MRRVFDVIRHDLYDREEQALFTERLSERTAEGYDVESCGISGDTARIGWAILSKPAEEPPKQINLIEAVKEIARMCRVREDCTGCPLSKDAKCLASEGQGKGVPGWWAITEVYK